MKKLFFYVIGFFFSTLLTLLVLEGLLHFFPVNEGLRTLPINSNSHIFKFTPNRTVQYSKHWDFSIKNKVFINNDGFVNNITYDKNNNTSLISLIGDSYIEALMVPYENTVSGLLQNKVNGKRVYSFAASGAGLSQHLVWAKYAKQKFNSNFFIFFIISNDFAESIAKYEKSPGFHRFQRKGQEDWKMVLAEYNPSTVRKVLRNSKLAMYLITNLKVHTLLDLELKLGKNDERIKYVSNIRADFDEDFWNDATWATRTYLDSILSYTGVDEKNILFVIDGIRPQLYDNNSNHIIQDSFWFKIRKYFIDEAKKKNFEILDMNDFFSADYKKNKKKFEFISDSHWNDYGHNIVAKSIVNSRVWSNFIE